MANLRRHASPGHRAAPPRSARWLLARQTTAAAAPPQLGVDSGTTSRARRSSASRPPPRATRSGSAARDAAADAAGVASALFPATGSADRPTAVVLVDSKDWQSAIAASVLAGPPIGAPLLLSDGGDLPAVSSGHARPSRPQGLGPLQGRAGDPDRPGRGAPGGLQDGRRAGRHPFERAAAIDRFVSAARGKPSRGRGALLGRQPRVGDARRRVGGALRRRRAARQAQLDPRPGAARRSQGHEGPNVYVLGPAQRDLEGGRARAAQGKLAGSVNRIEGRTPVENAIAFARYEKGDFGWGVVVPGLQLRDRQHLERPLDAAAAASLATRGVFAPLLLTDDAAELPRPLETYLLSVQPGLRGRPRPGRLQPRLDPRRRQGDLGGRAGAHRRDDRADPGAVATAPVDQLRQDAAPGISRVSEYERPDRLHREPTLDDVRQLMGASTPHFALQLRNRIRTLIAGLPPGSSRAHGGRARDRPARPDRARLGAARADPGPRGGPAELPRADSTAPTERRATLDSVPRFEGVPWLGSSTSWSSPT